MAPEYHRLNTRFVKHRLHDIEAFLAGAVGAFLIPFIKKIAEKAAEATWGAFASKRSAKVTDFSRVELSKEELDWAVELIKKTSASDRISAREAGQEGLNIYLQNYGIPLHKCSQATQTLLRCIEELVSQRNE